jgi:hypothetical protein
MKKIIISTISGILLFFAGCQNLDLNPLSEGSTENWYSNETEITMALNDLYRPALWYWEGNRLFHCDRFSDDWNQRETLYEWVSGSITAETNMVETCWLNTYKGITRANTILSSLEKMKDVIPEEALERFKGEAYFFRACFYSYLIFLWGDVPFYTEYLTIEDAFKMGRTDKGVILKQIYEDFDRAIQTLPLSYTGLKRVTKGAAYAFKARTAIWMLDWETAATAAKGCIDLDVYSLHPDFGELFLSKTRTSPELIFTMPRSKELLNDAISVGSMYTRLAGGTSTAQPSWELFCAFTCTDGLPIDKSPLFDPTQPYKNRDPRCAATTVEFGTAHLGFIYDPGASKVLNLSTNKSVTNKDSQLNDQYSAYNGMCLKKGVDGEWTDDKATDVSIMLMRYADVLLMYAEAKMELNQIDASVLSAINQIRARAYGVNSSETSRYPAVSETNQQKLRTIIRNERRVELAWENRRWFDLIRWRLAEVALTRPVYALPVKDGLSANIASGDYFFPKNVLPEIDENGLVDFSKMYATGKIRLVVPRSFPERQYLLPIPAKERLINENMSQNPGY